MKKLHMTNKYQVHEIFNNIYDDTEGVLKVKQVVMASDGTILPKLVSESLYNQSLDTEQTVQLWIENYQLVDLIINSTSATDIKIYLSDDNTNWLLYKQVNTDNYSESVLTAFRYIKVVVGPTSGATANIVLCAKRW